MHANVATINDINKMNQDLSIKQKCHDPYIAQSTRHKQTTKKQNKEKYTSN